MALRKTDRQAVLTVANEGDPIPRIRRAKWLPEREVDLVYLYSDHYLDARDPTPAETDFFTVTRMDAWGVSTWFMCTPQAAEKLLAMDYDNLVVKETTIVG